MKLTLLSENMSDDADKLAVRIDQLWVNLNRLIRIRALEEAGINRDLRADRTLLIRLSTNASIGEWLGARVSNACMNRLISAMIRLQMNDPPSP
jgi:hypothetical protein